MKTTRKARFLGLLASTALVCAMSTPVRAVQRPDHWRPTRSLEDQLKKRRSVRALVEFDLEGVLLQEREKTISDLKDALLLGLSQEKAELVGKALRFGSTEFMSIEVDNAVLRKIKRDEAKVRLNERSYRYRVELTPILVSDSTPTSVSAMDTVAVLLRKLGADEKGSLGAGYTVVVIDEGVDPNSNALHAKVVDGATTIQTEALCVLPNEYPDKPEDGARASSTPGGYYHGTKVAGIASAICTGSNLISICVGTGSGAYVTDVISALEEVSCRWSREHGKVAAVVISMSTNTPTPEDVQSHSKQIEEKVEQLKQLGIAVLFSAGNDGMCGSLAFPAYIDGAIAVGGVEVGLETRSSTSNWSSRLDLCAPGMRVGLPVGTNGSLLSCSGTSFSAPFVAGVIACFRERFPDCDSFEILRALKETGLGISRDGAGVEVLDEYGNPVVIPLLQLGEAARLLELRPSEPEQP